MTHGEDPGSETHQDSAVLTYLEGLLMHQVAGGPGATATQRAEAGPNPREQGDRVVRGQLLNHGSNPEERRGSLEGTTRHLKKARLLRSETGSEPESPGGAPAGGQNGQSGDLLHKGALNGSPRGESTLLASLLQSFSSRLQSVAMSQQLTQDLKRQNGLAGKSSGADEEAARCHGSTPGRLKGLIKKNKMHNHSSLPYHRRTSQEKPSKPPRALPSAMQPAAQESVSCAARLKAVASLVKTRSSPASSPKPSVACSQLALLLSSEAHLQQYSREQALKAQLSSRSASERLAAIATQQTQDKQQPNMGQPQIAPDTLSSLNAQNGKLPQPALDSSKQTPSPIPGQGRATSSPRTPLPFKEKRPPQTCSSLLLLLLNNHNTQKQINSNGHLNEGYSILPGHASPLPSESEHSNYGNGLTKDGSDADSSYSCCSPIDLSVRGGVSGRALGSSSSSSSLDKLTESLINNWKPETPGLKVTETEELKISSEMKSHQKVTLMQLLLNRKNHEKSNKFANNQMFPQNVTCKRNHVAAGQFTPMAVCGETGTRSPADVLTQNSNLRPLPTLSHGQDANGTTSPFGLYGSPQVQSAPLDLCKSKSYPSESRQEPAFSASKLLQNLAQCGLQNEAPSPPLKTSVPPGKRLYGSHELKSDAPVTLRQMLNTTVPRNSSPEGHHVNYVPRLPEFSPSASEIENLLERRTVLQLLLGTPTNKERLSSSASSDCNRALDTSCSEKQPSKSVICESLKGPCLDIKVKMEPKEESQLSDSFKEVESFRFEATECSRPSLACVSQKDIKSESFASEDGILSQLLKQQPRNYQENKQVGNEKGECPDHRSVSIPKKRKVCLEKGEPSNGEPCRTPPGGAVHWNPSSDQLTGLPKVDSPLRHPASKSPLNNSLGFNVLKQLLLSDNCLKDLSQPGGHAMPSHNHELVHSPWNPGVIRTSTSTPASHSAPGSPWGYHSPNPSHLSIKRETEGPVQWGIDEKHNGDPQTPKLTRANPILYYMLQKGSAHLRNVGMGQGTVEQCDSRVKEESVVDVKAHGHKPLSIHGLQSNAGKPEISKEQKGSLEKY